MSKKSTIAVCLCGLVWAGTAQAGFLGNNLELQFLQGLIHDSVTVSGGQNQDVGGTGIDVTVGDTTLAVSVPSELTDPLNLNFVDNNNLIPTITDAVITDATGSGNGGVSFGPNNVEFTNLSGGDTQTVTVTVPEPGALDLFALGLSILGLTTFMRRRALA